MPPPPTLDDLITRLDLRPHPEGGHFRETHRSTITIPRDALPAGYPADRAACTCILFLLPTGVRSRWHRVRSEEIWIHQQGDPLRLRIAAARPEVAGAAGPPLSSPGDNAPCDHVITLGQAPNETLQAVVPPNHWQDALALPGEHGYALVACVVAPGFDFDDFEMHDEPSRGPESQ